MGATESKRIGGVEFSPEARLLLLSCSPTITSAQSRDIAALVAGGLDWELVVESALWHGIAPLLYNALNSAGPQHVPQASLRHLRLAFEVNALRNRHLAERLVATIDLLEKGGIEALSLKGPALAVAAYGDLALRTFVDLDLLVRPADLARAIEMLIADGYCARAYKHRIPGSRFLDAPEDVLHKDLTDIDLHWRAMPRCFGFAPAEDGLFRRAIKVRLAGGSAPTLAPADLLLFLCVHAAKHGWPGLVAITDVALVIQGFPEIDYAALVQEARALRSWRMLLTGLCLAHDLMNAPVPAALLEEAREGSGVAALVCEIETRLFARSEGRITLYQEWMIPIRSIERRRDQLRYFLDRIFTPNIDDWEYVGLPATLFPLYYLIRPLRLALEHAPRLLPGRNRRAAGVMKTSPTRP